jgi:hypothetical protein
MFVVFYRSGLVLPVLPSFFWIILMLIAQIAATLRGRSSYYHTPTSHANAKCSLPAKNWYMCIFSSILKFLYLCGSAVQDYLFSNQHLGLLMMMYVHRLKFYMLMWLISLLEVWITSLCIWLINFLDGSASLNVDTSLCHDVWSYDYTNHNCDSSCEICLFDLIVPKFHKYQFLPVDYVYEAS